MIIKLNLIPQYRKDEINQARKFSAILRLEAELLFILAIFIAILFSMSYILNINLMLATNNAENGLGDNAKFKDIRSYDSELNDINARILEIGKIQGGQLYWSEFFSKLNDSTLPAITLSGIATKNYAILLMGKAKNRDDLILFKDNLAKENCFTDVNLPLSNLAAKENIDFQIDLKVKEECVKHKNDK